MPLGQTPEACSSLLFPQRLVHASNFFLNDAKGLVKANELLLLGRKMDAQEALRLRFLNDVFPEKELFGNVMKIAKQIANSPPNALMESKKVQQ